MGSAITLEQIINFLLEAPMFCDLTPSELSQVVHIMQMQALHPGQFLFREGEVGDAWYVLYEGEVEVLKSDGVEMRPIASLSRRSCFGEMAILDGSPRSASVRVVGSGTAFRFPRSEFQELLREGNLAAFKLVHQMALVLSRRQREVTAKLVTFIREDEHRTAAQQALSPIVSASSPSE